ncbi:hypothetical protein GCM10010309_60830 [Streptomyces violaceochromogenes]|nr:hypothetical protein GCM10010309_60830 [Streptomyces violaceochromogenes]
MVRWGAGLVISTADWGAGGTGGVVLGVRGSGFAARALGSVNVRATEGPRLGRPDVQDSVVVRPAEGLGARAGRGTAGLRAW